MKCTRLMISMHGHCSVYFEFELSPVLKCLVSFIPTNTSPVTFFYRYSRRIMWLEVRSTNNDAAVIADHFLGCVCQMKGRIWPV